MSNSKKVWKDVKVGDRIKVSTWNREGRVTVTRKVVQKSGDCIGIRCFGWNPFWLDRMRGDRIIEHIPAE